MAGKRPWAWKQRERRGGGVIQVVDESRLSEPRWKEWEALLMASCFHNPFLTPAWIEVWQKSFGHSQDSRFFFFYQAEGTLVGVGAFANHQGGDGLRGLELLGSTDVCDYRDLVMAPGHEKAVLESLGQYFKKGGWGYLHLPGLSEFSPTVSEVSPVMESLGLRVNNEVEEMALYLNLPSSWEEFLENLDSKDRHELRRKLRRIGRETSFSMEEIREPSSLSPKMKIFFDLHRKSRKDKAEFMTSEMENFFLNLSTLFAGKGWLQLSFLKAAGKEIATFLSFDFMGTEYVYNSGYDPQAAGLSPGIVLAALCIREAIGKGTKHFNFLRGKENYKYHLGGKEEKIYRVSVTKE